MSLLGDWKNYLNDANRFDGEHFERLLFEDNLFRYPEQLFQTLPGGPTIVHRLKDFVKNWQLRGAYFVSGGSTDPQTQVQRAKEHVEELTKVGDDEGLEEDAAALRSATISIMNDRHAFADMNKDRDIVVSEIPDLLFDISQDLINAHDPRLFGAYEAINGLTKRPEVTSWIMTDSISIPINLERIYLFYRDGGKILLTEGNIRILLPTSSHSIGH